jgi:hypothetical protein
MTTTPTSFVSTASVASAAAFATLTGEPLALSLVALRFDENGNPTQNQVVATFSDSGLLTALLSAHLGTSIPLPTAATSTNWDAAALIQWTTDTLAKATAYQQQVMQQGQAQTTRADQPTAVTKPLSEFTPLEEQMYASMATTFTRNGVLMATYTPQTSTQPVEATPADLAQIARVKEADYLVAKLAALRTFWSEGENHAPTLLINNQQMEAEQASQTPAPAPVEAPAQA